MYQKIMCDFGNIRAAYKLAHRGKSDAPEVIEFDKNKVYNLHKLQQKLVGKKWDEIFRYYNFIITGPKERSVDALTFEGRIVQHILCDKILRPYLEPRLVKENAACRRGKGTMYAVKLLKQGMLKALRYEDMYVLKIDVRKYFPSIDREILKKLAAFPDEEIRELLYYIIDNCPTDNGIPIGNQSSQWFALLYLDALDRMIKRRGVKAYVRYMDDLIVIAEKDVLIHLLDDLKEFAKRERRLEFNAKTQISPMRGGVGFLGWRFVPTGNKVILRVDGSKRKARIRTVKRTRAMFRRGAMSFGLFCDVMRSTAEHLRLGNTFGFRRRLGLER